MKPSIGDRVIDVRADEPGAIPATRVMFGTIAEITPYHVMVKWDCDKGFPASPCLLGSIRLLPAEEEDERRRTTVFR